MSKTLIKMFLFVEAEIFQGTAGICLQDEIEILFSNTELISQSMNKLPGMLVFFSFGYCQEIYCLCVFTSIKRTCYPDTMYKSVRGICFVFMHGND